MANEESKTCDDVLTQVSRNPGETLVGTESQPVVGTESQPVVGTESQPVVGTESQPVTLDEFHRRPGASQKRVGRKRVWDPEKAWRVLERIAQGETLKHICTKRNMPSRPLVYRWRRDPDCILEGKPFSERYAEAEADRTLTWEDEIVDIPNLKLEGDRTDTARVGKARLKFDTLKYVMTHSNPDRYGLTKQETGGGTVRIQIVNYSESFPQEEKKATTRVEWTPKEPLLVDGLIDSPVRGLNEEDDDA